MVGRSPGKLSENAVMGADSAFEISPFDGGRLVLGAEYKDYEWERDNIDLRADGSEDTDTKTKAEHGLNTTGSFLEAQYRPWILKWSARRCTR